MLNEPIKISTLASNLAGSAATSSNPISIDINGGTANKHISIYNEEIILKVGDVLSVFHSSTSGSTVSSVANYIVNIKEISSSNNVHTITLNEDISSPGFDSSTNDEIIISIIARTQNPQSRCSQLKKNINVYSFALRPEEHQPSGTCNFSPFRYSKIIVRCFNQDRYCICFEL